MHPSYDALVLVSFGGPEKPEDVLPFLENVVRRRNVPRERLLEVAKHYDRFGGVSPINAQNRALLRSLIDELNDHGPTLKVYWGNRNWHPLLTDTLRQMADDGVRRALAFVTSAFGSYSSCRQYLEDIHRAIAEAGPKAPSVDKLRLFYNHPGFIESMVERVSERLASLPVARRETARLIYSAHSIPMAMASRSPYETQLRESCRLVSEQLGRIDWQLVYQSRSGPPSVPWTEPLIGDFLEQLAAEDSSRDVILVPIGFLSEHMEVIYDLDVEVAAKCSELGLNLIRTGVVGAHPRFVKMIGDLIRERIDDQPVRPALGTHGPSPDVCSPDCCSCR